MSIYYISAEGNDLNDGLSPEHPWKTIEKVVKTGQGGDEFRFRCGDTFYGHIETVPGTDKEHPTVYTSYGEGKKPVISQFKKIKKSGWEKTGDNIYRVDLFDTSNYTGNVINLNSNAGFLKIDGAINYNKKFELEDLSEQWDFFSDDFDSESPYLYVYSSEDLNDFDGEILVACDIHCAYFADNVSFINLNFTGTGAHGICLNSHSALVSNCEFHQIGGSRILWNESKTTRYGNGVEAWAGSANITVENCKFSEIYDVAMTMQGPVRGLGWENIQFRNNIVWNCVQAFEVWSKNPDGEKNTGFKNCRFENNLCINSGYCWGYSARSNKHTSCHLLMYYMECDVCDILVCNNTFYGAKVASIYKRWGTSTIPEDYKICNNTFIKAKEQPISFHDDYKFYEKEGIDPKTAWGVFETETTEEEHDAFEEKLKANNTILDMPIM